LAASDVDPAAREAFAAVAPQAKLFADNGELASQVDVLFLAVKPQYLAPACAQAAGGITTQLIVSIVAGASLATLARLTGTRRLIRVMPNTPALVGAGAAAFAADQVQPDDCPWVQRLLSGIGMARQLPESLLDAVTGLSGSGPAYVFALIEALSDGGVSVGLPRDVATELAAQTVMGAARMVLETGEHPAALKDRVASPGGTTIAGLRALEDHGFRAAAWAAVEAATRRARQLNASADS
jgi:pyrroline-5-carboxylate reductase